MCSVELTICCARSVYFITVRRWRRRVIALYCPRCKQLCALSCHCEEEEEESHCFRLSEVQAVVCSILSRAALHISQVFALMLLDTIFNWQP